MCFTIGREFHSCLCFSTESLLSRLFRPSNSDDASHDEALSSRIAALNMLDLTLDHLGVDTGNSGPDVDRVVSACGESESRLKRLKSISDKGIV